MKGKRKGKYLEEEKPTDFLELEVTFLEWEQQITGLLNLLFQGLAHAWTSSKRNGVLLIFKLFLFKRAL